MANKLKDLSGMKFGELTVIERYKENDSHGKPQWLCSCSCGAIKVVSSASIRNGTKSCGKCKRNISPLYVRTHENRLYHTWSEMRRRCNGRCTNHQYYGDKGISYCSEWDDFDVFAKWAIENGYQHGLEIDRIDSDREYSPENCRWVTHKKNSRNRKARSNNTTGVAGVYAQARKDGVTVYRASIATDSGKINLGTFYTIDDAEKARKEAELKYWGFNIGE